MNWIVLLPPLLAAVAITLLLHPLKKVSVLVSILACAVSFAAALKIFFSGDAALMSSITWVDLPGLRVEIGGLSDRLASLMLLVVSGVGLCIHIFAYGYMAEDPGLSRFFAKLSFFMFSMLGIVLANNLIMMYIFWELVGLSSYFLIGFWFQRPSAAEAAKKAFIVNRIGDFGFLLGILGVWAAWHSLDFAELQSRALPGSVAGWSATLIALGLFMGCVGKSAQLPLHVWLPDAMEGPTPVSALIHAATMVAAGVYMLCRVFFILQLSPHALAVISVVGVSTAVFAAVIATQQNDIKRILAYSTLSQLGYMVMAVGLSATTAAMFHLTTHAFFKALLFLAAGSVIHSLHHEQDIWKMGGLRKKMPVTFWTFLTGTLALTGFPLLAGFWSKDAILTAAFHQNIVIFSMAVFTAGLTAYYMFRLFTVAFLGAPRSDVVSHAHESPAVMTIPLLILAVLSIVGGYLGVEEYLRHGSLPGHEEGAGAVMGLSVAVFTIGALTAWLLFRRSTGEPFVITLLARKFYIDEIYDAVFVEGQQLLARFFNWFDKWVIGGMLVRGTAVAGTITGEVLRLFQGGSLQAYAVLFILGVIFVCYWILIRPFV